MVYLKSSNDRPRVGLLNRGNTGSRILVKKTSAPLLTAAVTSSTTTTAAPPSSAIAAVGSNADEATQTAAPRCPGPARLIRSSTASSATATATSTSSSSLFAKGAKVIVQRASFFSGHSVVGASASLYKPFQRPMLKRRAYGKAQEEALLGSSLGQRRRFDGMQRLLQRAGRGLHARPLTASGKKPRDGDGSTSEDDSDDEEEEEAPFEPLLLWTSPHQGAEPRGLPTQTVVEERPDEYGVMEKVSVIRPAPLTSYATQNVYCPAVLAKRLRPHQREGVQFMYECVMGLKDFEGKGVILADDMGLGKTLQSVTLIYTLLKTGITANGAPTAKRVIVVCPCSLVKNWENEFTKWLGEGTVKVAALAEADRQKIEREINSFVNTNVVKVLIASYECIRTHHKLLLKSPHSCDLLVCDEAHRLKNSENQTAKALSCLPVKRRVLLTGTPMQNDLQEFYAMVDFTNPGILGSPEDFRRKMLFPILRGREPDATEAQKARMQQIQNDMSTTVNDFILRRVNTLNAQHLPPKLVQVVCCNLTEIQQNMYQHLITSKDMQHVLDGKQVNCLASIQMLMKLCNHPSLVAEEDPASKGGGSGMMNKRAPSGRNASKQQVKYSDDDKETTAAPGADGIAKFLPYVAGGGRGGDMSPVHPEWSGKMFVLYRLMKEMRKPGNGNDKIVIVSNYTQTLDLIGRMCRENSWGFCRLDGSIGMKKRQKMVDDFNDPSSSLIAFLLSSKAGGCGLNLIGGNRLVLFDPDWNPAVDKQAAARCWRDGQKKRCFTYRFMATGTVEEKIFQRQLSKEGLQSVVDDKEQVNALSTKDLRNLFKLRTGTPSDTHDKLKCERCQIIHDNAELEAQRVLPKKLAACGQLLTELCELEDALLFMQPMDPSVHGVSKEEYEKIVKQPMDFGTVRSKLDQPPETASSYKSVSGFSKDVNRIFSNVMKVWDGNDEIVLAARRLQGSWVEKWTELVPRLMTMKADDCEGCDKAAAESGDALDDILESCANVNNDRGDDYQEQIGMPDEENMRHWSHHHTTDTVDDPVFRAAMRGCDAVSFVFGLEVTWSLIQQRQQEEEEKIALQELNCLNECNGDKEEDEEQQDDEDCEPDSTGSERADNVSEDPIESVGEGTAGEMEVEGSQSLSEPDEPSSPPGANGSRVGPHEIPLSEAKMPEPEPSGDVETEVTPRGVASSGDQAMDFDVMIPFQGMQVPTGKENVPPQTASPPSADEWACAACTFQNPKSARKCQVCATAKPRQKKRPILELSV